MAETHIARASSHGAISGGIGGGSEKFKEQATHHSSHANSTVSDGVASNGGGFETPDATITWAKSLKDVANSAHVTGFCFRFIIHARNQTVIIRECQALKMRLQGVKRGANVAANERHFVNATSKTAIGMVLLVLLAGGVVAQVQTNLGPTNWTFTNLQGRIYSNLLVESSDPVSVRFRFQSGDLKGTESRVLLTNLPPEVRLIFHYDQAKADAFVAKQSADAARSAIDARIRRAFNDQKSRILAAEWDISAEVFQVVKDGVLIKVLNRVINVSDSPLAMLWQYPSDGLVDNQSLRLKVYPIGTYQYETVNGSSKTIMRFTASLNEALQMDFLQTHPAWPWDKGGTNQEQNTELQREHELEAKLRGMDYSTLSLKPFDTKAFSK